MGYGDRPAFEFGSLVRAYRGETGLTQRQLAARAGLSVAALRDFEQYRRRWPRPDSLAALAAALGLDPDQTAGLARAAALPRRGHIAVPSLRPPLDKYGLARESDTSGCRAGLWLAVSGPLK